MSGYTTNLLTWLKANAANKSVDSLLGERTYDKEVYEQLADIPHVGYLNLSWLPRRVYDKIPEAFMSKATIAAGVYDYEQNGFILSYYTEEITLPSLQGRKWSLGFSGNTLTFYLDEDLLSPTSSFNYSFLNVDIGISINHVHGTIDRNTGLITDTGANDQLEVKKYVKADTNAYVFLYGYHPSGRYLRHRQEILDQYLRDPAIADDSREVVTEILHIMGLSWALQTQLSEKIISNQYNEIHLNHHKIGRVAQENSYYIDVGLFTNSRLNRLGDLEQSSPSLVLKAFFDSALEHVIFEQIQGQGNVAASTVRILNLANDQGMRVYRANISNWPAVRSHLSDPAQGYTSTELDEIEELIQESDDFVLLSEKSSVPLNDWNGTGYSAVTSSNAIMKISGDYFGGYLSTSGAVTPSYVFDSSYSDSSYFNNLSSGLAFGGDSLTTFKWFGADPVDMASGAFVYDKVDLQLGQASPRGLSFARHYNSNRRFDRSRGLGYGWTHNFDIKVTERSSSQTGLGQTTAAQMAPYLVALTVAKDLYSQTASAKELQTAFMAIDWASEQLVYKNAAITMGSKILEFVQMPDGAYIPPAGIAMTLSKDSKGHYVLSERHGNTYNFDADNRISTIVDPHGLMQTFTYTDDQLVQVEDAYGRTLTFTWIDDRIAAVTDSAGRSVSYTYTDENLTTATDPDGHDWTFAYDGESRMTQLNNPKDQIIVENTYDALSRVKTQQSEGDPDKTWNLYYSGYCNIEENPEGGQTCYFYDKRGRSISVENALGEADLSAYDGQDHLIEYTTQKGETTQRIFDAEHNLVELKDPLLNTSSNTYDALSRLETATDFRGNGMAYTYNNQHQVLTITDRKGVLIRTHTYDADGNLKTVTDADDNTTTYSYDTYGNVSRIDYPDATFETFVYNARGDLLSQTDRRGNATGFTYNNRRQLLTTTFPDTSTRTNVYDSCGNPVSETDNKGNTTAYTYSPTNKRLTTVLPTTAAGTATITHEYDTRDWLERTTDPLANETGFAYDSAGRVVTTTDPLDREFTQTFDANGRVISVINSENETTGFAYDARGLEETQTDALNQDITYTYDNNSNRTGIQNRRSQDFTFTYDANNRQLSLQTPLGHTTNTTYNDRGLLETLVEPSTQTLTFTYDAMARLQTMSDDVATAAYEYDENGNPTTVTEDSITINRSFDNRNRVTGYTDALGNTIGYQYDSNNNLTQLTYPDGKTVIYTYDERNQLVSLTDWNNHVTNYTYDLNGRLTEMLRPNGTSRTLVYDAAGQITRIEERRADGCLLHLQDFAFDGAGRITREFIAPTPQPFTNPTNTTTYDADNRIATFNDLPVTYDVDGNMTRGPLTENALETYTYDARNRLKSVGGISYQYDAEGNRIRQMDASGATEYAIEPNTGLSKVLVRTKPDGSKTFYVYGIGLQYEVDEAENTLTYHYDYRGSTRLLTSDDGQTVTDKIEYTPYGSITHREGSTDTPFLYNGMYGVMTDGNGLLQMRARYFNPYLKRFVNADPIGFEGGMNWYQYAGGNPIMYNDPSGNAAWLLAIPLVYWGSTQIANAPGPSDPTFAEPPFVDEALLLSAAAPAVALSRTAVGGLAAGGRSFMNTLTAPTTVRSIQTQATTRAAGTMSFETANTGLSLMTQAGTRAFTNTSQQFASKALTYTGVYTAGSFVSGGITGLLTPTDASSLFSSGNPLLAPYEVGNLVGSLVGDTYNALNDFFTQPTNTNFK